jgi:hypothetical protein
MAPSHRTANSHRYARASDAYNRRTINRVIGDDAADAFEFSLLVAFDPLRQFTAFDHQDNLITDIKHAFTQGVTPDRDVTTDVLDG